MRLEGDKAFVELERAEVGPLGTPGDGDLVLNVTVRVYGYSAADQSWVVGGDWERFLSDLRALEARRQGSAVVEGASPDDLRLEILSTDSLGHLAIRGHIGWRGPTGHDLRLTFGFDFEPDRVPKLLVDLEALAAGL